MLDTLAWGTPQGVHRVGSREAASICGPYHENTHLLLAEQSAEELRERQLRHAQQLSQSPGARQQYVTNGGQELTPMLATMQSSLARWQLLFAC